MKISEFLLSGRSNAVPLRQLQALTGLDGRTIRRMIERERRGGSPILSDNQTGYYLAADPAEAQHFTRSMRHRAGEILRTTRAIERAVGLDG